VPRESVHSKPHKSRPFELDVLLKPAPSEPTEASKQFLQTLKHDQQTQGPLGRSIIQLPQTCLFVGGVRCLTVGKRRDIALSSHSRIPTLLWLNSYNLGSVG